MPRPARDLAPVVLPALLAQPGQTAKELQVPKSFLNGLASEGVVKVSTRKQVDPSTGEPSRGRPSHVYSLADKGRKRAKRLAA